MFFRLLIGLSLGMLIAIPTFAALDEINFEARLAAITESCGTGGDGCLALFEAAISDITANRSDATTEITDFQLGALVFEMATLAEAGNLTSELALEIGTIVRRDLAPAIQDTVASATADVIGEALQTESTGTLVESTVAQVEVVSPN